MSESRPVDRRGFLLRIGWGCVAALLGAAVPGLTRFLAPHESGSGGEEIDVGPLTDYRAMRVSTRWVHHHGLWLVHRDGKLVALEARCTHLGCTPQWEPESALFRCPCHGSRFATDGSPVNGPAIRPLARFAIRLDGARVIVDRSRSAALEVAERDPGFFLPL